MEQLCCQECSTVCGIMHDLVRSCVTSLCWAARYHHKLQTSAPVRLLTIHRNGFVSCPGWLKLHQCTLTPPRYKFPGGWCQAALPGAMAVEGGTLGTPWGSLRQSHRLSCSLVCSPVASPRGCPEPTCMETWWAQPGQCAHFTAGSGPAEHGAAQLCTKPFLRGRDATCGC